MMVHLPSFGRSAGSWAYKVDGAGRIGFAPMIALRLAGTDSCVATLRALPTARPLAMPRRLPTIARIASKAAKLAKERVAEGGRTGHDPPRLQCMSKRPKAPYITTKSLSSRTFQTSVSASIMRPRPSGMNVAHFGLGAFVGAQGHTVRSEQRRPNASRRLVANSQFSGTRSDWQQPRGWAVAVCDAPAVRVLRLPLGHWSPIRAPIN
jgi:hypothetical protein